MSMTSALASLRETTADLNQAVAELVMIALEDRPARSEMAIVDRLTETVSELQASAMLAHHRVAAIVDPRALAAGLALVDEAVAACASSYWRDLRAFDPVRELRRTAYSRGLEWRTWQRSLELSAIRCEGPLDRAGQAVRAAWVEVGEHLDGYLPRLRSPELPPAEPSDVFTDEASTTNARRPS